MRFKILTLFTFAFSLHAQMCPSVGGLPAYDRLCAREDWPVHLDFDGLCFSPWHSSGTTTLFVPFFQLKDNLFFLQGTGGRFENLWMGSFGGGGRSQYSPNFGCGLNAFVDYGHSNFQLDWWQFGFGAEAFGGWWEARVNGYVPGWFNTRIAKDHSTFVNTIVGTTISTTKTRTLKTEKGRWGFDAEAGAGLPIGCLGTLWGFGGFFRFEGQGIPILQGPRARLQWRMDLPLAVGNVELYVGGEWEKTKVYGDCTALTLHVSIPIGIFGPPKCCCLNTVCRQMGRSVCRMPGIVVLDRTQVIVTHSSRGLFFFAENGTPKAGITPVGSQTNPTTMQTAFIASAPGDFLFALNDGGVITNPFAAGAILQNGQSLYAFTASTPVGGIVTLDLGGGNFLPITALPGNPGGTIHQSGAASNLLLSSDTLIDSITLTAGANGVSGNSIDNFTMRNATITGQSNIGIGLSDVRGKAAITNNTISSTFFHAFELINSNQPLDLIFNNNTISNVTSNDAIVIVPNAPDPLNLVIQNNIISSIAGNAISIQKQAGGGKISGVISGNTMSDLGASGIALSSINTAASGSLAFNVQNNSVSNAGGSAYTLQTASSGTGALSFSVLYQNNTSHIVSGNAFSVTNGTASSADTTTVSYQNNTMTQTALSAISLTNSSPGPLNATLTNNGDTGGLLAQPAYPLNNVGNGTLFATLTGNNTDRGANKGITLTNSPTGVFKATYYTTLSSLNNNISVTNPSGTITNTTANSPTPVVPTAP